MSEILSGLLFQCGISELDEELAKVPAQLLVDLEGSNVDFTRTRSYLRWPIDDSSQLPDTTILDSIVDVILSFIDSGLPVIVHCAAGINRASLITAEVVRWREHIDGKKAVQWVREHRPGALTNATFVNYLEGL